MSNSTDRQLLLVNILLQRGSETLEHLADELEVSVSTIRRDISDLSNFLPIFTQRGKGGGVVVDDRYRRNQRGLTSEQKNLLLDICKTLNPHECEILMSVIRDFSGGVNYKEG